MTSNEVAALYGELAGITPKVSHIPAFVARILSAVLKPVEPGLSRVMYMASLPNDAYSEVFAPNDLLKEFPMQLTTLEDFIGERIAEMKKTSAAGRSGAT